MSTPNEQKAEATADPSLNGSFKPAPPAQRDDASTGIAADENAPPAGVTGQDTKGAVAMDTTSLPAPPPPAALAGADPAPVDEAARAAVLAALLSPGNKLLVVEGASPVPANAVAVCSLTDLPPDCKLVAVPKPTALIDLPGGDAVSLFDPTLSDDDFVKLAAARVVQAVADASGELAHAKVAAVHAEFAAKAASHEAALDGLAAQLESLMSKQALAAAGGAAGPSGSGPSASGQTAEQAAAEAAQLEDKARPFFPPE